MQGIVVVVTGAGRGLGAAFAIAFADVGCELVLCGRSMEGLTEIARLIAERGGKTPTLVALDLADSNSISTAIAQISANKPKVDILINNGAMWLEASAENYPDAEVLGVINSGITGTFLFTQGLLKLLQKSDRPDVVLIGSTCGFPNAALENVSVPFYAAKRGQAALADGLRQVFSGTSIRSIAVHPANLDDARPGQPSWEAATLRQKGDQATNRDVVEAVLFAVSRPRNVTLNIVIDSDCIAPA
jgi:NADP-dependent 3-hydroxy acid dehydrogenase YdfG